MAAVEGRVDRDRAQMVLIGALALAVSLVVLAVVLNSAIYTENLATRSSEAGVGSAVDAKEDVRDGVGGIADRVNENHSGKEFDALNDTYLPTAMDDWRPLVARHLAVYGRTVGIGVANNTEGTRIADANQTSDFLPLTNSADYSDGRWMVTAPAKIRSFHITDVSVANLSSPSPPPTDPKGSGAFYAEVQEVQDGGHTWRVAVYENGGNVEIAVYNASNDTTRTCSTPGPATIDLTGGTLNGKACPALTFFEDIDGLAKVHYVNGGNITGTYELTVDRVGHSPGDSLKDQVDIANYGNQCSGPTYSDSTDTSPFATAAIYSTTVDFRYVSQSVTYDTQIRAANDEPGPKAEHPRVTNLTVTDNSGDSDASFDISWDVADPNGDLDTVTAKLEDEGVSTSTDVSGGSASGSVTLSKSGGAGNTYTVVVEVTDDEGHSRSASEIHTAGDAGCPP